MPPTNEPDGNGAAGTGGEQPTATQQPQTPPAATPQLPTLPEGYEAIRTEDKNKLISARDKANDGNSQTSAMVAALAQKDAVREAMATPKFKADFPDVEMDDILDGDPGDPEEILAIAKRRQESYERVKQSTLQSAQIATAPTISQADKDAKLAELRKPSGKSRFQQAAALQRAEVK